MKKIVVGISLVSTLFLGACSTEQVAKEYMKDTYGVDVEIIDSTPGGFELGYDSYWVALADHPALQFDMKVYDSDFESDELVPYKDKYFIEEAYSSNAEMDKEFHKLDTFLSEINKLGISTSKEHSFGKYENDTYLYVHTTSPMEVSSFEKKDLSRLYAFYNILKKSGTSFTHVYVADTREPHLQTEYLLDMEQLKEVKTKEEFFVAMKKTNTALSSFQESTK